jgi:hypothetical protein
MIRQFVGLFLRIRHVRKIERLASFRQRDPRIPQPFIMFTLLRIVRFLRQRCAPSGRFPGALALGSHRSFPFQLSQPRKTLYCDHREFPASSCPSLFLAKEKMAERERDRRENGAGEVKGGKEQNRGAKAPHRRYRPAGHAGLARCWWVFMVDADHAAQEAKTNPRPSPVLSLRQAR